MWEVIKWIPVGIVFCLFGYIWLMLWADARRNALAWDEEEERQQRVKDLYPEPPSYEERMGVQYGPKSDE